MTPDKHEQTLFDAFKKIIEEKREYATGMTPQVSTKLSLKQITPITAQHHKLAIDNLDACSILLDKGEHDEAFHFFSRACANLGELIGRADKEKKAT